MIHTNKSQKTKSSEATSSDFRPSSRESFTSFSSPSSEVHWTPAVSHRFSLKTSAGRLENDATPECRRSVDPEEFGGCPKVQDVFRLVDTMKTVLELQVWLNQSHTAEVLIPNEALVLSSHWPPMKSPSRLKCPSWPKSSLRVESLVLNKVIVLTATLSWPKLPSKTKTPLVLTKALVPT